MSESSDELRRRLTAERRGLSAEEVLRRSEKIRENFLGHFADKIEDDTLLGLYRPSEPNTENEPDPMPLLRTDAFARSHFAFPRVLNRFHRSMDFAIPIHASDWALGIYGLLEPRHELPGLKAEDIDVLIIPGVAFGVKGERIGRGVGFYDRFLNEARGALRVAFAYDFQVLAKAIPQETWDAPVDWIITDQRVIETHARL